jgi:hypothetical protein
MKLGINIIPLFLQKLRHILLYIDGIGPPM